MNIIPAIDLRGGRCVRLFQGQYDQETQYSDDPAAVASRFASAGFAYLHVVDLDGARDGTSDHESLIRKMVAESGLTVQLGGGLRTRQVLERWFEAGISRCVIGSVAVNDAATVKQWLADFGPDRIVLALDVRHDETGTPLLATHGWLKTVRRFTVAMRG